MQPSLTSGGNDGCSVHYRDHRDPKRFGRTPGASHRLSQQQFRGGWSVPVHTSLKSTRDAMIRDSLWKSPEDHARPKIKRSRDHVNPRRHVVLKFRTPHAFRQRTSLEGSIGSYRIIANRLQNYVILVIQYVRSMLSTNTRSFRVLQSTRRYNKRITTLCYY